jgi:hypothetical protein
MTYKQKKFNHNKYRFNRGYVFDIVTGRGEIHPDYPRELVEFDYSKSCKVHRLNKGNGKYRIIYAPNSYYKKQLRRINVELMTILDQKDKYDIFHAFRNQKNVVTNAKKHVGFKYTMKIDLFNFFDCVREDMVKEFNISSYCFINGCPRQGLPTSPMVASLALLAPANAIYEFLQTMSGKTAMTVYADDITISFNNRSYFETIRDYVYEVIKAAGLKVNYRKTKLLFGHKNDMRRIICGISVGKTDIRRSRDTKNRIKKAIYDKENESVIAGLLQWEACREPNIHKQKYKMEKYLSIFA